MGTGQPLQRALRRGWSGPSVHDDYSNTESNANTYRGANINANTDSYPYGRADEYFNAGAFIRAYGNADFSAYVYSLGPGDNYPTDARTLYERYLSPSTTERGAD